MTMRLVPTMMHLVDQALKSAVAMHYDEDATPQTLYRVKQDLLQILAGQGVSLTPKQARQVRVEWDMQHGNVNLRFPPELLRQPIH